MKITPLLWPAAALLLLSACGAGGYQQGYASPGSTYTYAAPTYPKQPGFYPVMPDFRAYGGPSPQQPPVYQAPPAPQPPPSSSFSFIPPAAAGTTSSRRETDPPVAVDRSDCGWWRLSNLWCGR